MAQIKPRLVTGSGAALEFKTLDDFHPDAWFEKFQLLADLRKLKKELSNPNMAEQAAAKIQAYFPSEAKPETAAQPQNAAESSDDMLERLLGRKPEKTADNTASVDQLIKQIVSPHITKDANPQHRVLTEVIDAAISQFLRGLLHRQDFQNLEALWRATEKLVKEDGSDELEVFLVDISRAELLAELTAGSNAFTEKLLQHAQAADEQREIVLIADYCFSSELTDQDLLNFFRRDWQQPAKAALCWASITRL